MKAKLACILALALAWTALGGFQAKAALSADPLGQSGSMDLYSYCNGDPVNELDPDGCLGKGALEGVGLSDGSTDAPSNYTPQPGSEGAYQERVDDIMAGGGVTMDQAEQEIAAQDYIANSPEAQSAILNLIPGVSLAEGIVGSNFVTGQALSGEQRYLAVNLGAIGLAGGLSGAAENFAADEAVDTSLGTALDQNVQLTQYQLDLEGDAAAAEGGGRLVALDTDAVVKLGQPEFQAALLPGDNLVVTPNVVNELATRLPFPIDDMDAFLAARNISRAPSVPGASVTASGLRQQLDAFGAHPGNVGDALNLGEKEKGDRHLYGQGFLAS